MPKPATKPDGVAERGEEDDIPAVSGSPDASLTQDDSFTATSHAGLTYPWGEAAPRAGETIRIADGVSWARIPMPGSLGHINSWLLDDATGDGGDGVAVVDTGICLTLCSDAWKALYAGALRDARITRVIGTHLHPDHIGLAGWIAKKCGVKLWMTRGEMLTARAIIADISETVPEEALAQSRAAGWDAEAIERQKAGGWGRFGLMVFPLPRSYVRIKDGDVLDMGAQQWRVVTGSGHSPEHACLWNERAGVLISGDQVLPRISSNVSVNITEPDADPLGEWLASIDKLLGAIPSDVIVCPAHGEPFKGLHVRLTALRDEHRMRLYKLAEAMAEAPMRAVDTFPLLFNRPIGADHQSLATGEAFAHLKRLEIEGRVTKEDRDGVWWYHGVA
ncbi:MBL fold metallo-hydrolase [Sphingopyxis panaciterrulae]|uniref:Glyoxylase-like metal-dependent hydrolase (Beta-lactamase superfamily II) n=1 Tax=Sphingopyxis panaciterrulae TaxID=462372 RepID=A0A7W9B327_9SPHN|nr:MBL fold metallo-hydrolase [Sphingopyxis panaciterrulae]MBB5705354.1 glyoxylase-like metal-dependent hydrolase (beta-lactamase superfamily II) [Sphingopyxis panaciterrulae]